MCVRAWDLIWDVGIIIDTNPQPLLLKRTVHYSVTMQALALRHFAAADVFSADLSKCQQQLRQ